MDIQTISTTIKDTSRSIYIQLLAGKTKDSESLINDIKCLEDSLSLLKSLIMLDNTSDLKGLAQREAMR